MNAEVDYVTVSPKGQVVLPMGMRNALSIASGDKLAVYFTDEVIMMKPVKKPTVEDFSQWLGEAQAWAKSVGYKEEDVNDIIKSVRQRKRQ